MNELARAARRAGGEGRLFQQERAVPGRSAGLSDTDTMNTTSDDEDVALVLVDDGSSPRFDRLPRTSRVGDFSA